ncbi:MAG: M15 family metallopeptidase [Candidatus Sericytochromatia bacterium]|nr:M15 family metallopeptidase [Candidatus Tanganyikabacteria bacterium]
MASATAGQVDYRRSATSGLPAAPRLVIEWRAPALPDPSSASPATGDGRSGYFPGLPSTLGLGAPAPGAPAATAPQASSADTQGLLAQLVRVTAELVKLLPALLEPAVRAVEGLVKKPKRKRGPRPAPRGKGKRPEARGRKASKPSRDGAAPAAGAASAAGTSSTRPTRGRNGEIRTVTRDGKPIGANIAAAFDKMVGAAKEDGVTLRVNSGYRSNAEQRRLWAANPNPALVARPGTSNHEKGNAIDFANIGSAWSWLKRNARRFGFKNYPVEAWHYDFVG